MNRFLTCTIVGLLALSLLSAGCIKIASQSLGERNGAGDVPDDYGEAIPLGTSPPSPPGSGIDGSAAASGVPSSVSNVEPIYPAEHYRTIRNLTGKNGEAPANRPLQYSWSSRTPLYTLRFSPGYNASAIQVNVTKSPLVIIFRAVPKINEPRVSYAEVSVRTLPSRGLVAVEHIDHFLTDNTGTDSPTRQLASGNPNVREIVILREGLYHINVYGNQVDVDLAVYTADSPTLGVADATILPASPPEEEMVWA